MSGEPVKDIDALYEVAKAMLPVFIAKIEDYWEGLVLLVTLISSFFQERTHSRGNNVHQKRQGTAIPRRNLVHQSRGSLILSAEAFCLRMLIKYSIS
jgi:hypothetical protein